MTGERGEQRQVGASLGIEQRLEFVEIRLLREGHVNRSDVMTPFAAGKPHDQQIVLLSRDAILGRRDQAEKPQDFP